MGPQGLSQRLGSCLSAAHLLRLPARLFHFHLCLHSSFPSFHHFHRTIPPHPVFPSRHQCPSLRLPRRPEEHCSVLRSSDPSSVKFSGNTRSLLLDDLVRKNSSESRPQASLLFFPCSVPSVWHALDSGSRDYAFHAFRLVASGSSRRSRC